MTTLAVVKLLFAALALVMVGLGLSLEVKDFRRLAQHRRAVGVALVLQHAAMPAAAYGLTTVFGLPAPYAIGMMLLAAAPGSISSNLYSHLFGGNVALNVSLTGINTVVSMATLPLICGWALVHFAGIQQGVSASVVAKLTEAMLTLITPVVLGMFIRAKFPAVAERSSKPVRVFSVIVLIAFSVGAIVKEWTSLVSGFTEVGLTVLAFNALSLAGGYFVSRVVCGRHADAMATAFELGVRSAVLSIYVAITTLQDTRIAIPAAVYSITMVILGFTFGFLCRYLRRTRQVAGGMQVG